MGEELVLDVVGARRCASLRYRSKRRTIPIRVRRVIDTRQHRPEAATLDRLTRRQRQRPHGPSVEAAEERDDVLSPGGITRELQARLDRLGPRVAEERADATRDWRKRSELLRETDLRLVVEVGPRHV